MTGGVVGVTRDTILDILHLWGISDSNVSGHRIAKIYHTIRLTMRLSVYSFPNRCMNYRKSTPFRLLLVRPSNRLNPLLGELG